MNHQKRAIIIALSLILLPIQMLVAQQWTQLGSDIDGEAAFDNSGHSIGMNEDGTSVIIGAAGNSDSFSGAGHARVYELINGEWMQKGNDIDGEAEYDGSGKSVAMNSEGNIIAIGAVSNSDGGSASGHVRVYEWDGSSWIQKGSDIDGDAPYTESGNAIDFSADGNTIIIGASKNDEVASNAGQVRVYEWDSIDWTQKGMSVNGDAANDSFGFSVGMSSDGNTIGIGAPMNSNVNVNGGQVKFFEWNTSSWVQKGTALYGEDHFDRFGYSISLNSDANAVAVGAIMNDNVGADAGHVRVFEWNDSAWQQKGSDIDGEAYDDNSGSSVSISTDGNTVAIGAKGNDGISGTNAVAGQVRVYLWYENAWAQLGDDIDGESDSDFSGQSCAVSADGSKLAVGAHWNSGNGTSSGHVRVWSAPEFTNVGENDVSQDIQLFPNPTLGMVFINLNDMKSDVVINVKNALGQTISSDSFSTIQATQITLEGASGMYYVEIKHAETQPHVFKVFKR